MAEVARESRVTKFVKKALASFIPDVWKHFGFFMFKM